MAERTGIGAVHARRPMLPLLLAALPVASLGTAGEAAPAPAARVAPPASATVSRDGSGWRIEYRLRADAKVWAFPVSAPLMADLRPWRQASWRVTSPGASIERRGAYDVLVGVGGRPVPRTVRIAFVPTAATLEREYDPAIAFSDGPVALYSDQFDVAPVADADALARRPAGLSAADLGGAPLPVRFHDAAGPVFVQGGRRVDPVLAGAQTYVVFGGGRVETIGGVAMLADPALPGWLKGDVAAFAPRVAAFYAARLGKRGDPRLPLLLMGWRGATAGKVIDDGGVRPGEIVLNFEGDGLLRPDERAARRTRWFVAHEMAHFWLGTSGVAARTPGEEWITEGGAEMMAFTLLAATDREHVADDLQRAVDDCVRLGGRPVAGAGDRHEPRAFYACGTVLALAAASLVHQRSGGDYLDFLRPLLEETRERRTIGEAEWLGRVAAVTHDDALLAAMKELVETGSPRPSDAVATILERAGVPLRRESGAVVLLPGALA